MKSKQLPPMNALRAFESVSRHINVSKAAKELSVTPSAVSHLIRRLEGNLGIKLVQKSGRNILLTDAGKNLGPELQEIFYSLRKLITKTRDNINTNIVTVSLRPYFAAKWLAPKLNRFWSEYPEVQLHLHHSNDEVDFIFRNVDFSLEWCDGNRQGVSHHKVVPGELTPVLSPALAGPEEIKNPQDLFKYALLRETDHDSWQDWFNKCNCTIPDNVHSIYIDDSNVRYQAAIDGQGIELGCRSLILDDISSKRLIAPFDIAIDNFSYYLTQLENRELSDAAKIFSEWILGEVSLI